MKATDKIREISGTLSSSGIESASKEAELLVREVLGISLADLYKDNPEVTGEHDAAIGEMASRRAAREPLQYILGHTDFLGLKILVGKGVLIPRPETELMAEHAVKTIQNSKLKTQKQTTSDEKRTTSDARRPTILDLCTGSGCLALALAKEFPDADVYGTDISDAAISYAIKNAVINGIENVSFLQGNLFEPFTIKENENPPLSPFYKGGQNFCPSSEKRGEGRFFNQDKFDLIISNPPYVRTDDMKGLQPEIRDWEPVNALDGGADGLDLYREIVPKARPFLADDGILMLELGAGCSGEVHGIFERSGYSEIKIMKDYAGIERIIHAKWTR